MCLRYVLGDTGMTEDVDNSAQPPREVLAYYARGQEDERLEREEGKLERCRTELLLRHLPAPPAVVLDVGGGTGRYATCLATRGYTVHLVDPVLLHLDKARARSAARPHAPLARVEQGDARRLDWPAGHVDAVVSLGPLHHVTERSDRIRALSEPIVCSEHMAPPALRRVLDSSRPWTG